MCAVCVDHVLDFVTTGRGVCIEHLFILFLETLRERQVVNTVRRDKIFQHAAVDASRRYYLIQSCVCHIAFRKVVGCYLLKSSYRLPDP